MSTIRYTHYNPPNYGMFHKFKVLPKYYMHKYILSKSSNSLEGHLSKIDNVNYIWYNSESNIMEIWGNRYEDMKKCRNVIENYIEYKYWEEIIHEH